MEDRIPNLEDVSQGGFTGDLEKDAARNQFTKIKQFHRYSIAILCLMKDIHPSYKPPKTISEGHESKLF